MILLELEGGEYKPKVEKVSLEDIANGGTHVRCPSCGQEGYHNILDFFKWENGHSTKVECGNCDYTRRIFTMEE